MPYETGIFSYLDLLVGQHQLFDRLRVRVITQRSPYQTPFYGLAGIEIEEVPQLLVRRFV